MLKNRLIQFNKNASWLKKGVICHRGKHDEIIKENTVEAFKKAIEDNLSIELDVRLTKDNKVIVCHDEDLKRVFGVDGVVEKLDFEEICRLTNNQVPLFEDVLKYVDNKVGLMIEVKSVKVGKLEEEVYNLLKQYKGNYVIVSFNPFTLNYFRKKDPSIIRGQLSYHFKDSEFGFFKKLMLRRMWLNVFSKPHFISYGIERINEKFLTKLRKKGYYITGWTYKNEKNKSTLSKFYDNMIVEGISIKEF